MEATYQSRPTVIESLKRLHHEGLLTISRDSKAHRYSVVPYDDLSRNLKTTKDTTSTSRVIDKVIEDFNRVSGKNIRLKNKEARKFANARLNEGFTLADFKRVHRNKAEWLDSEKMFRFYRPSTLYRPTHFDEYLNEGAKPAANGTPSGEREAEQIKERYRNRLKIIKQRLASGDIDEQTAEEYRQEAKVNFGRMLKKAKGKG